MDNCLILATSAAQCSYWPRVHRGRGIRCQPPPFYFCQYEDPLYMSILTTNNLTNKSFWFYFSKNSIKQRTIDNTIQLKWELLQDPGSRTICVQAARLQTLLHCLSASSCCCGVELQTMLREGFTITEKVPTSRAFSWLEAHLVGAFSVIVKSSRLQL